jgi:hypothetical protein
MNGKLEESILHLISCNKLETQTFKLYETLSKKINQPESSFMIGFAYDSLKCAKTIQAITDYFDMPQTENLNFKKDITELTNSVTDFSKKISKINNIDYEIICESLKELSNLEEQLGVIYTNYADSPLVRVLSDEFSSLAMNTKNFKKIFEKFNAQKQSHKEELLEIIYFFETKEADRLRNATPVVRYQNPNSWVQASFKTAPSVPA